MLPRHRELKDFEQQSTDVLFAVVVLQAIVHSKCNRMHHGQTLPLVHVIVEEVAALVQPIVPIVKEAQRLKPVSKAECMSERVPARECLLSLHMGLPSSSCKRTNQWTNDQ